MLIDNIILTLKRDLIRAFAVLDSWFDHDDGWLADKQGYAFIMMERIMLTNNHLLSLINNGCREALMNAKLNGENWTTEDYDLSGLAIEDAVADDFFKRLHPRLQKETKAMSVVLLREELRDQLYRALCHLELLRNGEGSLHAMSLFENEMARIDIYQLMHLLASNIWKQMNALRKTKEGNSQKIEFD